MPLFEAVHNALHAVDDLYLTEVAVKGRIKVTNVVFQHGPCIRDPSNRLVVRRQVGLQKHVDIIERRFGHVRLLLYLNNEAYKVPRPGYPRSSITSVAMRAAVIDVGQPE